ncbi:MAG: ATP-binding protein [bacterium]|nr:ATP-binding protein [bacterium]
MASEDRGPSAQERLRIVTSLSRTAVWEWDVAADAMQWVGPAAELLGVPDGAAPTSFGAFLQVLRGGDADEFRRRIERVLSGDGAELEIEIRRAGPDDTADRWLQCVAAAQFDAIGAAERLTGTLVDVTSRRSLEAQLRQAQKMESMGQLAGGVAHDFNNVLTVIRGEAQCAQREPDVPEAVQHSLRNIEDAAGRGQQLTTQLLTFARQQALQIGIIDLESFLADVTPMLRRLAGERVVLDATIERPLGQIRADQSQLEQVFMNLVVNAKDAMDGAGTIKIHATRVDHGTEPSLPRDGEEKWVRISVRDSGPGIPPQHQERLFDAFFTTKPRGTGLGLSTSFGIIAQSGGTIRASESPAPGAEFVVLLPCATSNERVVVPGSVKRQNGSSTILLIEDEDMVRRVTQVALERAGYDVLSAPDAESAMTILERRSFDLIITDVGMPGIDGATMTQQLGDQLGDTHVLYVSGRPEESEGLTNGPRRHFLAKPFSPTALADRARAILDEQSSTEPA